MASSQVDDAQGAAAVMYLRVSSKEQAEKGGEAEGYSIPAQRDACRRKAESLGAALVEEFVERGESAKTADRPELQRMLIYVRENRIKYVIVHKVDRLARNRADDVAITMAIRQAGAELVSVSENIDETPSGLLLHGIMSSIAEFYSRNLAHEVMKGSLQKAKSGGTPCKAPVGYLNIREVINGQEGRSVVIDPERGPLMKWAFEAYATGDWTVRGLLEELTERGLTSVPGPRRPAKVLSVSQLHRMLHHPYYVGVVRYKGVLYPGKHEALVDHATWQRVQELLTARNISGERRREHEHYLKGSIFCGGCGSRLIVTHATGRGGVYPYFICIGRQDKRTDCKQRALHIDLVEDAVTKHYATVQLPADEIQTLRAMLEEDLSRLCLDGERERRAQGRRLNNLEAERKKLLAAHYADAIPLDLLKSEQTRLSAEAAAAERRLSAIEQDFTKAESNLQRALTRVGDCQQAYTEAPDELKRQFNQAFFKRLLIDEDYGVAGELTEPFDWLLGDQLRRAAAAREAQELQAAVDDVLRTRTAAEKGDDNEQRPRVAVGASQTRDLSLTPGLSKKHMVPRAGLEPAPPD
jgi:site-specific DNA recombinase